MTLAFIAMGVGFVVVVAGVLLLAGGGKYGGGAAWVVILMGLVVGLGGMFRAAIVQQDECRARGGHMVDRHTVPIVITSGKTTTIIVIERSGCVVVVE